METAKKSLGQNYFHHGNVSELLLNIKRTRLSYVTQSKANTVKSQIMIEQTENVAYEGKKL